MSFLYYENAKPSVKANFQSLRADEYFVKDPETGGYVPLTGGGGETPELPYYLKPAKIDLGVSDSVFKTVVEEDGVDVIDIPGDKATNLSSTALTFGDSSGNVALEKRDVKILKDLQTFTVNNPSNLAKMLIFDAANQRYAATPWRAYLNTDTVMLPNPAFSLSRLASTGLAFRDSTYSVVGKNSVFTDSMVTLGSRNVLGFDVTHTKPRAELTEDDLTLFGANSTTHARLNRTGVQINDGVTVAALSLPNLQTLEKIHTATDATASSTSRMLVREEDGTYKQAPIPSGGTPLPVWCKTSEAEFTSGDRHNKVDYQGMNLYRDASRDRVGVGYDSMTVCRSNDGISTDTTKAFTTIMRNSITLAENNDTSTILNYSRAKTLENLHAATDAVPTASARMIVREADGTFKRADLPTGAVMPKTYRWQIPWYSGGNHINGVSYFPRWASISPNGQFWSGVSPVERRFKLDAGDAIVFKSTPGINQDPGLYFNTWYCVAFAPSENHVQPSGVMVVEGSILHTAFEFGYPVSDDGVRTTIDIRPVAGSAGPATPGSIAFRINGTIALPDTSPGDGDKYTTKAPSDPFFGKFSLKVITYNSDLDIEEATTLPIP